LGVDQDRQDTARERKHLIREAFDAHLSLREGTSAQRFRSELEHPRTVVTDSDIDGLVASSMVASVSDWRVGAIVLKSGELLVSPEFGDIDSLMHDEQRAPYGLDVFSVGFPNVSNHPVTFGATNWTRPAWLRDALRHFDAEILFLSEEQGTICPSAWVGTGASLGTKHARGMAYKYPLGTAQVLLALLEVAGRPPRFYDRQYLPWLIANCDGGVETIRTYPWNVENWWSALAAVAGPASQSEALYRLVANQRPTEFLDVDRRLRWDEPERSQALNSKWNLAGQSIETMQVAIDLIIGLSGWPDPFLGGVGSLVDWNRSSPTRGVVSVSGLAGLGEEKVRAHLGAALSALHMNFSNFKERGVALGWMTPNVRPEIEALLGPEAAPVEESAEDEPSEPPLLNE
jgi:hypothetical protein